MDWAEGVNNVSVKQKQRRLCIPQATPRLTYRASSGAADHVTQESWRHPWLWKRTTYLMPRQPYTERRAPSSPPKRVAAFPTTAVANALGTAQRSETHDHAHIAFLAVSFFLCSMFFTSSSFPTTVCSSSTDRFQTRKSKREKCRSDGPCNKATVPLP